MLNLAIIGAGMGGCSAAHFARKYFPNSRITVFEMEKRIGGRIFTFKSGGIKTELGATFFNPNNKIVSSLVDEFGLKVKNLLNLIDVAVWNGNEIQFRSKQSKFYTMLNLLNDYKFNIPKLLFALREINNKIIKLYSKEKPSELGELFESLGLDKWYKRSLCEILVDLGVDQKFIDEIVTPITRIIYSQNAEIGGFAGISSLLGVYGKTIYSLKDGNDILPTKLVEQSTSTIELENKVNRIEKTSTGSFNVQVGDEVSGFDAVIIATPLEIAKIRLEGITHPKKQESEFQKIYIRLMMGDLNRRYFNLDSSEKLPSIVLTSKEADPITRFSIDELNDGSSMVAVTSTKPIRKNLKDDLFIHGETVQDHTWNAAYPIFKPIKTIPLISLDEKLLYVNALSPVISSLESTAFSALNSIKLLKKQIKN
ncbi:FAD-dependent oxidoreductase [Candidatus Bathyarchaeota archaeon]|nr:FAD-dependent oxidoreductase [Candidatus Bathyarchaeota archaeon]